MAARKSSKSNQTAAQATKPRRTRRTRAQIITDLFASFELFPVVE
jgi:nitrate reductase NapE component